MKNTFASPRAAALAYLAGKVTLDVALGKQAEPDQRAPLKQKSEKLKKLLGTKPKRTRKVVIHGQTSKRP